MRAVLTTQKLSLPWNQNLANHVDWLDKKIFCKLGTPVAFLQDEIKTTFFKKNIL